MSKKERKFDYIIDWNKVNKLEDVIQILKSLNLRVDISKCPDEFKQLLIKKEES